MHKEPQRVQSVLLASLVRKNKWPKVDRKILFLLVLPATFFIPGLTIALSSEEVVDMNRILQKAVRELVRKENVKTATDEITRLDEANKVICFCYLKDGVSNGSQEIRFTGMADGDTRISHLTHYRSHSAFRDKDLIRFSMRNL